MKGVGFILELLFKGLLQWLFDMIINITEYLANSLLAIFNMDLSYFESNVPVTSDIVNIMIGVGWALLLGNMVFQAAKSMATGLGFEGEDPRTLFSRTFVMAFLLLASRQVCDMGLGIANKVISMLQVPETVQVPQLGESDFSVPGDASWLLVIIIGIILISQLIKLFFEISERYVIVAVLTILSPLAFSMGGSKNTADIFKGWVRMFASMCLMMVLSVVFLKFILSAMSDVPTGVAVVPWTVFIVALAKAGRKIDGIIARIGLNTAVTGDQLSRMPGMMTYMVMRNMTGSVGKAAAANKSGGSKAAGAVKPAGASIAPDHGASPMRPPIGSSAAKSGASPITAASGGYTEVKPSASPSTLGGMELPAKGLHGMDATSKSSARPDISKPSGRDSADALSTARSFAAGTLSSKSDSKPVAAKPAGSMKKASDSYELPRSPSADVTKASAPSATKPSADTRIADKAKGGSVPGTTAKTAVSPSSRPITGMPASSKLKPGASPTGKTSVDIPSRGESVKAAKDTLAEAGKATRPSRPPITGASVKAPATREAGGGSGKSPAASRPLDTGQKDGNVVQSQLSTASLSTANITVQQKASLPKRGQSEIVAETGRNHIRPKETGMATGRAIEARKEHSRPTLDKMANPSKSKDSKDKSKPSLSEAAKATAGSKKEAPQAVHNKGFSEQSDKGMAKESYKDASSRPEMKPSNNSRTGKSHGTSTYPSNNAEAGAPLKTTGSAVPAKNIGVTNTTLSQTVNSTRKPASKPQDAKGRADHSNKTSKRNGLERQEKAATSHTRPNRNNAASPSSKNSRSSETTGDKYKSRPSYQHKWQNEPKGKKGDSHR